MEQISLERLARDAAAGDRAAAQALLGHLQDGLYQLALRMLGHPQDAEDATQEVLLIVLTHLGSFRGDSAFRTWAWRIAVNHLLRMRRGRMETVTFDSVTETLAGGLRDEHSDLADAEEQLLAREVRLRCTEAMLLSLDRESRIAFVLGDLFALSGEEAAAVLEVDPSVYRKRLSRARARLLAFLRRQCGVYDPANACRCDKQVAAGLERAMLLPGKLLYARHTVVAGEVTRCAQEVGELLRMADVIRHPAYAAPAGLTERVRALLDTRPLELLEH